MFSSADPGIVWTAAARGSCWRSMPACLRAPDAANLPQHEHLVSTWRTRYMLAKNGRGPKTPLCFVEHHHRARLCRTSTHPEIESIADEAPKVGVTAQASHRRQCESSQCLRRWDRCCTALGGVAVLQMWFTSLSSP